MHRSMSLGVVGLGLAFSVSSAFAGGTDPHGGGVAPTEDASHACPALERKYERAKDADEAARFKDQLIFHGCLSCDGKGKEILELAESERVLEGRYTGDKLATTSLYESIYRSKESLEFYSKYEYVPTAIRVDYKQAFAVDETVAELAESLEREAVSLESEFRLRAFAADMSYEKAELTLAVFDDFAYDECESDFGDTVLIGCRLQYSERAFEGPDCLQIEKELLAGVTRK